MTPHPADYRGRHVAGDAHSSPEGLDELVNVARWWIDDDPDPTTRDELRSVITAVRAGDEGAADDLADRFSGMLGFGTAGLRGRMGAGPNRMNRAVVLRAAAGLLGYLLERVDGGDAAVVVGFDARHCSDEFARDTAAVTTAFGGHAMVLGEPLPTPVLAFAIRHLGADAGVMVTASHNPASDNGYKVYLGDGRQIAPPTDSEIGEHIDLVASVKSVRRADDGWNTLDGEVTQAYLDAAVAVVEPGTARDVRIVHTALHGVGDAVMAEAFARAGFTDVVAVAEQQQPDPDFPTVAFPNPEEPGALDLALATAARVGADLVVANDPDADRCALAVPDGGGWRVLRGDEIGAILASRIIVRGVAPDECFASTIVSSRLLAAMCAQVGVRHVETLTGFKWISRAHGLRYGYEEALGYCVDPGHVADKDGITAALLAAEIAAILKAEGRGLLDILDDLHAQLGVHLTDAYAVRVADLSEIDAILERLAAAALTQIAGVPVARHDDLSVGVDGLPPTEGLRWFLADGSRIVVRPSGTEPKLKVYLEVIEQPTGRTDLAAARARAGARLTALRNAVEPLTSLS